MGSGYRAFATAEVLTAANVNNYLMTQSVMYFDTTGTRDTAITSPVDGMVAYVGSNNSSEGLYTYNGTSWRMGSWNMPWGAVHTSTSNTTETPSSLGAETTIKFTAGFTAVANRLYRVSLSGSIYGTVSGDISTARIRVDSNTGTVIAQTRFSTGPGGQHNLNLIGAVSLAAGTRAIYYTVTRELGTGAIGSLNGLPMYWVIEDIGPNGAPV